MVRGTRTIIFIPLIPHIVHSRPISTQFLAFWVSPIVPDSGTPPEQFWKFGRIPPGWAEIRSSPKIPLSKFELAVHLSWRARGDAELTWWLCIQRQLLSAFSALEETLQSNDLYYFEQAPEDVL